MRVFVCHIMGSGISVSHNWDHFDNGKGIYVTTGDLLSSRALVIPQQEPSTTPTHTPGDPAHTHTHTLTSLNISAVILGEVLKLKLNTELLK